MLDKEELRLVFSRLDSSNVGKVRKREFYDSFCAGFDLSFSYLSEQIPVSDIIKQLARTFRKFIDV
jgi:hypothetical protein